MSRPAGGTYLAVAIAPAFAQNGAGALRPSSPLLQSAPLQSEPPAHDCKTRPGRRNRFHRNGARRRRRGRRRSLLQHLDDRLPGNPDRSELPRADRHDDLPRDRQLRGERRGRREPQAAPGRVHRPREEPPGEQLPRRRRPGRLSETLEHRRPGGDRHPRPGAPAADPRGHEGRALVGRSRRRQPGGQGEGQSGPGGPRPGARSDPRGARRVDRAAESLGEAARGRVSRRPAPTPRTSWPWTTA